MVKAINLKTSSQTDFKGHMAPVLSVAIHPDDHIIVGIFFNSQVKLNVYFISTFSTKNSL